jgi:hypothetical protein
MFLSYFPAGVRDRKWRLPLSDETKGAPDRNQEALERSCDAERGLEVCAKCSTLVSRCDVWLVVFIATTSRGATNGNNDRLSILWPEVTSLAGVARSLFEASSC